MVCWSIAISNVWVRIIASSIGVVSRGLVCIWIRIISSHHRHHGLRHLRSERLLNVAWLGHHQRSRRIWVLILIGGSIGHIGHKCWLLILILLVRVIEILSECWWSRLGESCSLGLPSHLQLVLFLLFFWQLLYLFQLIGPKLFKIGNTFRRCARISPIILTREKYPFIVVFRLFDCHLLALSASFNYSTHRNKIEQCREKKGYEIGNQCLSGYSVGIEVGPC